MQKIVLLVILLFFIAGKGFAEERKATPECIYTSSAEVIDGRLVNKKEEINCIEYKKPNVLISAMTGENLGLFFQYLFGTIFFAIENL